MKRRTVLLVTTDGVVRLFELQAEGNAAGHPAEVSLTVEIDDIGAIHVEEPLQLEEARDKTEG